MIKGVRRRAERKYLLIPVLFLFFTAAGKTEAPLESFMTRAKTAEEDIVKSSSSLSALQAKFHLTEIKIQELKNAKAEAGITGFINSLKLKYYLSAGNRAGYRIYKLEAGIRALKEDYFTYVSLITEEYGSRIKDCFEKKCPNLKNLCDKRREWAGAADKYGDFLTIDLSSMKLIKDYSKGAEKDIKDYLQKKIVQAEQRIYMLEEEKGIFDIMKKANLSAAAAEKRKNADKIAGLKKLKKELQEEIKKIK